MSLVVIWADLGAFIGTLRYKQALLEDIIYTYREAEEIRVYEDRPKQ